MLNNYIQNKLSEAEIEQVELWLADNPDVMKDLEMGVMFKQADFDPSIAKEKSQYWFINLFSKPTLVFSHVAVFALGMFLLNLLMIDKPTVISNPEYNGEGNIQIITLSHLRGGDENEFTPLKTINIDLNAKQLIIVAQLDFPESDSYKIEIQEHTSKKIKFQLLGLYPIGSGDLNFSVPTDIFEDGNYWIIIKSNGVQFEALPIKIKWSS
jgi:hypothetical protein